MGDAAAIGASEGTAQEYGIASRTRIPGSGVASVTVSVSPDAFAETTSLTRLFAPAEPKFFTRWIARSKLAAETDSGEGGEKPRPGRTVNVYVFPSGETDGIDAAASGWTDSPAGSA